VSVSGERPANVVVGVTGSIAAHRAIEVVSQLVKAGCAVRVVMTSDAQRFVTPLPFKTLSRNPVITDLYDEEEGWKPSHIRVADEADLLLVAPATATLLRNHCTRVSGRADSTSTERVSVEPGAKSWPAGAVLTIGGRLSGSMKLPTTVPVRVESLPLAGSASEASFMVAPPLSPPPPSWK